MRMPTEADAYPFAAQQLPCLVGGEFVRQGRTFDNVNPVNGLVLATVTEADAALVDRAVQAARGALRGPWARLSTPERCALLRKVAERIEQRFDEFVSAEIADTGKTLEQARSLDIPRGAANFRAYAELATARGSGCFEMATPDGRGALNYSVHKPVGVVAVIAPWNLPFLLMTWKVAPALACGNAVVAKPSEETPSSAALLAQVMQEVGMPPGVFNLVHGFGPRSTGEALVSHPDVNAIAFTGESATGSAIMRGAADSVKALSYYRLAREEHGEIVCGGGVPSFGDERDRGAFIEPTVVCGLAEGSRCVKEEIFGPVCHLAPFDSEDEAVRLANDTRYGLAAAVWTSNLQRAHRVARQMEVGIAWVNDWYLRDLRTPFGGVKLSGIGREGGAHSLAFFSEPMNICVKL